MTGESEQSALGTDIPKTYNIVSETRSFSVKYIEKKTQTFSCSVGKQSKHELRRGLMILTVTEDIVNKCVITFTRKKHKYETFSIWKSIANSLRDLRSLTLSTASSQIP